MIKSMTKKILIITLILLACGIPFFVKAATLYLMPQRQTVYQGDSFLVEVRLDTGGEDINTVAANLSFPDLLEVIDFSQGNSILTLWPQKPQITANQFSFVGGIPQGFTGEGLLLKINFLGKDLGQATVTFKEDSKVLLNDGRASEAVLDTWEGNYEVVEKINVPLISSRTHPDQNKWYSKTTLHLKWDLIEGSQYSFLLTHDPLATPDEIPDRPEGELLWLGDMNYTDLCA